MSFVPSKLYYKIGEVCEIVGVEAHVLRYWESEFSDVSPPKNKSGQRTYRPKDIETLLRIRKLLYDDGYTIAGARRQLVVPKSVAPGEHPSGQARRPSGKAGKTPKKPPAERIRKVREELQNILTLLDRE